MMRQLTCGIQGLIVGGLDGFLRSLSARKGSPHNQTPPVAGLNVTLRSWRGLRAPSRLKQLDPTALREEADSFSKEEIMSKFSKASTIDELEEIYSPLVNEFNSDIVTIQISSINQEETIKLLGKELLPRLKK